MVITRLTELAESSRRERDRRRGVKAISTIEDAITMNARPIFAGAACAGLMFGTLLAAATPVEFKPMDQPEWRTRAMALREETSQAFAYSMPEDLSPKVGWGNPAVNDRYAKLTAQDDYWIDPTPVAPPRQVAYREFPQDEVTVRTGNESTIAQLKSTSDDFESASARPDDQGAEQSAAAAATAADRAAQDADAQLASVTTD